jgi:hypothetical protein
MHHFRISPSISQQIKRLDGRELIELQIGDGPAKRAGSTKRS